MKISKWFKYKDDVVELRKAGTSLPDISRRYGIAKSTLSYWFKDIELSDESKKKIKKSADERLVEARLKSAAWHRNEKQLRVMKAEQQAKEVHNTIPKTKEVLELALSMLYFGKGGKSGSTTMGASDSFMLKFFITSVELLYDKDRSDFRYDLHLRNDQNEKQLKQYWASKLDIPIERIRYVSKDPRSIGKPTYKGYMGVCQVYVGDISILRRLKALYNVYCSEIISGD
jgi:hypothetical protein